MKPIVLGLLFALLGWSITGSIAACRAENSSDITETLHGVNYVNGRFISVGDGVIASSTDGICWTKQTWGGCGALLDIDYGNGKFMAVGDSILVSTDGEKWTSAFDAGGDGIVYGDGKYVAVNGGAKTSTDGIEWEEHTIGSGDMMAITWGEPGYVAVGYQDLWRPTAYYSTNGASWLQTFYFDIAGVGLTDITFANSQYVSGGYQGAVIVSTDGIHWERYSVGAWIEGIAYGRDKYVVVSDEGTVAESSDGRVWSWPGDPICELLSDIAFGSSQFVAIGSDYDSDQGSYFPVIFTSPDARIWTRRIPLAVPSPTPFASPSPCCLATPVYMILSSGDYNGDGTSDIALFRPSSGLWAVRDITRTYFGASGDLPVSGDYDGDGTADMGVFRQDSGLWSIRDLTRAYLGSSLDRSVPSDYDGDGTCDRGIFRRDSGMWAIPGITRIYFGTQWDLPAPGDFNGDGTEDITILRRDYRPGFWAVRGISRFYFWWGGYGNIPESGDYDGDGIDEAAVYEQMVGLWMIRDITYFIWGYCCDSSPAAADYDGDGAQDAGVFNEAGWWSIRGLTRIYFGATGDIPVTR